MTENQSNKATSEHAMSNVRKLRKLKPRRKAEQKPSGQLQDTPAAKAQLPRTKAAQLRAGLLSRFPGWRLLYLVPHLPQDLAHASPIAGFTQGIHKTASVLIHAATLPMDIREPVTEQPYVLISRLQHLVSAPNIVPIETAALRAVQEILPTPFRIYLTNDAAVAHEVDAVIATSEFPCLHVSSEKSPGRLNPEDLTLRQIVGYVLQVLDRMSASDAWKTFASAARREIDGKAIRGEVAHPLLSRSHNVTAPNEAALLTLGWRLNGEQLFERARSPDPYVAAICESFDAVENARDKLLQSVGVSVSIVENRLIIAVPSFDWAFRSDPTEFKKSINSQDKALFRQMYRAITRADSYFDRLDIADLRERDTKAKFMAFMGLRAADARSFTAGLTILSSASVTPTLRIEPRINRIWGDLRQLGMTARTGKLHLAVKLSRMTLRIGEKMRDAINPQFLERIDRASTAGRIEGLKIVSDLPLELIPVNGLTAGLRFNTSRQAVMPGSIFLAGCVQAPTFLPERVLREILVVRSFRADDPLRDVLRTAIDAVLELFPDHGLNIRFVDVHTADDFVSALEGFQGALMIFDGHGAFDNATGAGTILLSSGALDAWALKGKVRLPPIVLFSACDTQPLDGSHSSSATAAFILGAQTVLATTLPIHGIWAATFIGRLLLRISKFLPLILRSRPQLTWREFLSGMLRMTHITEIVSTLGREAFLRLTRESYERLQTAMNAEINLARPDWFESFISAFAAECRTEEALVRQAILKYASLTEAMKYVQLGSPETIIIGHVPPSFEETAQP